MKSLLCMLLLPALVISAGADEFYLDDAEGKTHGPFEMKEGTKLRVGDKELTISRVEPGRMSVIWAMSRIRIPKIDFRDTELPHVIDFLQKASVEHDKEKQGVKIILDLGPEVLEVDDFDIAEPQPPKITMAVRDISVFEALKMVLSRLGLTYRIRGGVVVVSPRGVPDGDIVVRSYIVKATFMERLGELENSLMPKTGQGEPEGRSSDPRMLFEQLGVEWPRGSSLRHVPTIGKLVVANTVANLTTFERILWVLDIMPSQIEVEVQFVAFDRGSVAKLMKKGITTSALTNLWSKGGGDLLAAPLVVTKSGCEAMIKGVTECIYPTSFTVFDPRWAGTNAVTDASKLLPVAEPGEFETREAGVIFLVVPEMSGDGNAIDVTFMPRLVQQPVWEDYGGKCAGPDGKPYNVSMRQPFFHEYAVSTSVSVADGAKVLAGGGMLTRDRKKVVFMFLRARRVGLDGKNPVQEGGLQP